MFTKAFQRLSYSNRQISRAGESARCINWITGVFLLTLAGLLFTAAHAAPFATTFLGSSSAALSNPHDLKLSPDGNYLLVSDVGNNRVAILDPDTLELIGSFGSDHQSGTHDIDFDAMGQAYVADTHNNRVTIYQLEKTTAKLIGELNQRIRGPEGAAHGPRGCSSAPGPSVEGAPAVRRRTPRPGRHGPGPRARLRGWCSPRSRSTGGR